VPKSFTAPFYRAASGREKLFGEFRGNFHATTLSRSGIHSHFGSAARAHHCGHPMSRTATEAMVVPERTWGKSVFLGHVAGFATPGRTDDLAAFCAAFGLFGQLGFGARTENHR
jgi:hypothetical protein